MSRATTLSLILVSGKSNWAVLIFPSTSVDKIEFLGKTNSSTLPVEFNVAGIPGLNVTGFLRYVVSIFKLLYKLSLEGLETSLIRFLILLQHFSIKGILIAELVILPNLSDIKIVSGVNFDFFK